jgi:hypothetical protein
LFLFFEPNVSPVAEGLTVLVFAFPLTWIFVRSARNVLVATVLHSSLNAFSFVAAGIPPAVALWYIFASGCRRCGPHRDRPADVVYSSGWDGDWRSDSIYFSDRNKHTSTTQAQTAGSAMACWACWPCSC